MSEPKLEQYPGYYPAGSKPFWSRTKIGATAGIAGLLIGIAGGGSDAEEPQAADNNAADVAAVQADLDEALAANDELSEQFRDERQEAASQSTADAKAAKIAQRKAVRAAVQAAVARTRREERQRAATAVAAAERQAEAAASPTIAPLTSTPAAATDPRFSYCYEANAAGYGPYYRGQDPEYAWYDDRDGDGVVCET